MLVHIGKLDYLRLWKHFFLFDPVSLAAAAVVVAATATHNMYLSMSFIVSCAIAHDNGTK